MKKFTLWILSIMLFFISNPLLAQNVWTQHNDQGRTGWYPYETTLNTSNVNKNTFGLNFSYTVDDKIIAQPLVVLNVNIPNKGIKNVVYVATLNNTIFAFDADANVSLPYWQANFTNKIAKAPAAECGNCRPALSTDIHPSLCGGFYPDFNGNMGIIGTPVIDTATFTMYFVSKVVNLNDGILDNHTFVNNKKDEYKYTSTCFHQFLHAIDIRTGIDLPNSPVEIAATAPGAGDGQTSPGIISFEPRRQFNRAALALNNGILYIAFAAHCDMNPSHGWVISYDATTLAIKKAFIATPNDGRGGIWMSGVGPAIDAAGNLYFTTGNSLNEDGTSLNYNTYNAPVSDPSNRGEGITKLAPDLTLSSFFTPFNYKALNDADLDFGTQVMILPNTNNLAMTGCKDDSLYVFDMNNLGGFDATKNNTKQRVFVQNNATMHSTFGYFGGPTPYAYQYSENSPLKAYPVTANGLGPAITNTTIAGPSGGTGGFLSVSSNAGDPASGIVWAYQAINGCNPNGSDCQGIFHAINANDITKELWNSNMITGDKINVFNKFSCPTIALGKVYLAANINQLYVYGLKANTSCLTNQALTKTATALTNIATANNVTDGNLATAWTSQAPLPGDVDSIYIDLGGSIDICKIAIAWTATGFGQDFDIKVSNNKTNWTIVKSFRGNTSANTEFNGAITARYVSMVGIKKGANPYAINEFQVFGNPASSCSPPTGLSASPGSKVTIFTTQIPASNGATDAPVELGVQFRSSIDGFITGVRFYKTSIYTGTHTGELYTSTGTRLAQAIFTNETATGWQIVTFPTPIAIKADTTYVAAYYNATGKYTADNFGLTIDISNGPLTALANGGVFSYSATPVFPTSNFHSSNYWVDPIFTTTLSSDANTEHLNWDAVPNAASYIINYRPNLSASWITKTSVGNFIDLTALTCGSLYFYSVQANCGATQSVASPGSFTPAGCPSSSCEALPTRYYNVDLGDIGMAGSTCLKSGVYTLSGSGSDIGGNSDQFQFAYTSNDISDYEAYGHLTQQVQVNSSSKFGIMVRDSLTNTSRFAFTAFMGNGIIYEYRDVPSGPVTTFNVPGTFTLPYWMKVSKTGTKYTAFISPDGITWTKVGSQVDLHFGNDGTNAPHYGMAITSANNLALSTGKIDNFTVTGSTPLPIKLLNFSAKDVNHDHVLVSWATSMEHLVDYFEIQRSDDNQSFQTFDKVKAVGESETLHNYSVNDNNPAGGVNYYRLKETDKDGKFYFSPVVSVRFEEQAGLEIYPNPASDYAVIHSPKYPILEVRVYDVTGKLLQNIPSSGIQTSVQLNTAELSKGVYFISVKTTGIIYRQKLFKQ